MVLYTRTAASVKLVTSFKPLLPPANNAHLAPPHLDVFPSILVLAASQESTVHPKEYAPTALAPPTPLPSVKRPAPPARVACGPTLTTLAALPT